MSGSNHYRCVIHGFVTTIHTKIDESLRQTGTRKSSHSESKRANTKKSPLWITATLRNNAIKGCPLIAQHPLAHTEKYSCEAFVSSRPQNVICHVVIILRLYAGLIVDEVQKVYNGKIFFNNCNIPSTKTAKS